MKRLTHRQSDERVLHWLQLRLEGWSLSEIGKLYGVRRTTVGNAVSEVRKDDAMSGEDIGGFYA